ncbi:MAG: hypothetical protein QXS69_03885 [Candidatus Aenigmatarchaeota archaeon]
MQEVKMGKIKSGDEFLKDFFEKMVSIPEVNENLANKLKELFKQGRFTDTNIKNMLDKLIEGEVENEN